MSMVLVVDDDPDTRSLVRLLLEIEGHAVVEAADGEQALNLIGPAVLPDVVVTDLIMPVLSGLELIQRLHAEPMTAAIPIIVVSGDLQAARALQTAGAVTAVVTKPFVASAFAEVIRAISGGPMNSAPAA